MRQLIKVDGTVVDLPDPVPMRAVGAMIGAKGLDTVVLRHMGSPRHVMIVDDTGMVDGKPANEKATELYWKNCRPGTIHPICGDVLIVPDDDYS